MFDGFGRRHPCRPADLPTSGPSRPAGLVGFGPISTDGKPWGPFSPWPIFDQAFDHPDDPTNGPSSKGIGRPGGLYSDKQRQTAPNGPPSKGPAGELGGSTVEFQTENNQFRRRQRDPRPGTDANATTGPPTAGTYPHRMVLQGRGIRRPQRLPPRGQPRNVGSPLGPVFAGVINRPRNFRAPRRPGGIQGFGQITFTTPRPYGYATRAEKTSPSPAFNRLTSTQKQRGALGLRRVPPPVSDRPGELRAFTGLYPASFPIVPSSSRSGWVRPAPRPERGGGRGYYEISAYGGAPRSNTSFFGLIFPDYVSGGQSSTTSKATAPRSGEPGMGKTGRSSWTSTAKSFYRARRAVQGQDRFAGETTA